MDSNHEEEEEEDYDDPFQLQINLAHLDEEEAKFQFSLLFNAAEHSMVRRDNSDYLRPMCIDGIDVSNRMNRLIRKSMELFPADRTIFNMRAITLTLWYFISRGHQAIVFLPTNLREFAQRCSDPQELSRLAKLELVVFDGTTFFNPSSPVILSKTIATCAQNSDGCIVGSRNKYALLGQKYPELLDTVTNSLIRPSFTNDRKFRIVEGVRMVIQRHEVRRNEGSSNCLGYQMLVTDQVVIMNKLARVIGGTAIVDMCNKARELAHVATMHPVLRYTTTYRPSSSDAYSSPYHYDDPFLPEYVAPPQPCALESSTRPARIGHKHSIYRMGGAKKVEKRATVEQISPFRMALIEALEPMFGGEKASKLVRDNPEIDEINELLELGIAE